MSSLAVPFGVLSVLVLTGVSLGILALFQARMVARDSQARVQAVHRECEAALQAMTEVVDGLAGQLREARQHPPPPPAPPPAPPRPGLNLSKRSQALRMHRHGETPEQIGKVLEVPPQEIDLLLKVHRLVIKNL